MFEYPGRAALCSALVGVALGVAVGAAVPDSHAWVLPLVCVFLGSALAIAGVAMRAADPHGGPGRAFWALVAAVVVGGATWGGVAIAQSSMPGWPDGVLDDIDAVVPLPAKGFQVVESGGRAVVVSLNGHYAMVNGGLWDMWNGFEIRSVDDVERSKAIPLERLGLGEHALAGITLQGSEPPPGGRVTVFLDPAAPEGADATAAARGLQNRYAFRLVFVPAHDGRYGATQRLLCAESAAREYARTGQVGRAGPGDPACGYDAMLRNLAVVRVLGIDALPFTIAPNGRVLAGVPRGYGDFLAANER